MYNVSKSLRISVSIGTGVAAVFLFGAVFVETSLGWMIGAPLALILGAFISFVAYGPQEIWVRMLEQLPREREALTTLVCQIKKAPSYIWTAILQPFLRLLRIGLAWVVQPKLYLFAPAIAAYCHVTYGLLPGRPDAL